MPLGKDRGGAVLPAVALDIGTKPWRILILT